MAIKQFSMLQTLVLALLLTTAPLAQAGGFSIHFGSGFHGHPGFHHGFHGPKFGIHHGFHRGFHGFHRPFGFGFHGHKFGGPKFGIHRGFHRGFHGHHGFGHR